MSVPQHPIDHISAYKQVLSRYEVFASSLCNILQRAAALYAPLAIVQTRAKSLSSFAEKAARKADKYADPLRQMTDLCGARVITQTQAEADRICRFIEAHFEIDWSNSENVRRRLSASEFGYLSVHYVATPKGNEILGVPIPPEIRDKKAEIQVRTILQHAWSDLSHDRLYKSIIKNRIPERWKRESARLAAILEDADESFQRMTTIIDTLTAHYGPLLSKKEFEEEVGILATLLEHEEEAQKPRAALRLARLYASVGQWQNVIDTLGPYRKPVSVIQTPLDAELGRALCELHRDHPKSEGFRQGQELLAVAARAKAETGASGPSLPDEDSNRAAALAYLADAYRYQGDIEGKARELYYEATKLTPANPYYLLAYLEEELAFRHDAEILQPMRVVIQEAITRCREHIELGIEIPRAHLAEAKLRLLVDEPYRALSAYARAMDLCLTERASASASCIDDEIWSLTRLRTSVKQVQGLDWAIHLLQLAIKARTATVDDHAGDRLPVLIVLGDCGELSDEKRSLYASLAEAALTRFEGIIVYGGVTAGVPRFVSEATNSLRVRKLISCELHAYLPKLLPAGTSKDPRPDVSFVVTAGTDFSPEEPLASWDDILRAGRDTKDVRMLCMGGDESAGFACRLALAMGATVGVLPSSGGAASEVLSDPDWNEHTRLLALPADKMTLWAFVNLWSDSPWPAEVLEEAARKVHEHYVKTRKGGVADLALVPWEFLPEDLKESNRRQVLDMHRMLECVGYVVNPRGAQPVSCSVLPDDTIEVLAEVEHGRWNVERLRAGWTYGPEKDIARHITPYLVPWHDLSEEIRQYDRDAAGNFAQILYDTGFAIARRDLSLT